ncbi:hypothetical protein AB0D10_31450 [Kitasatospora sp. NPDC048545]|uniref:hypothetical protein n=1 Tax=Kitasatospora sp. NPDC048545 TaxID=3157208 RepID=UPI0033C6CAC8
MIVGVIAVDVYVSTVLAVCLGILYPVLVIGGLVRLHDADSNPRFEKELGGWEFLIALVGLIAYLAGVDAWDNLVLSSGRNVTAKVVDVKVERSSHGSKTWTYTVLSAETGAPLPGGAFEPDSHRFTVNDVITVRVDPAGWVAPKLRGEADSPAGLLTFVGCNVVIDLLVLRCARAPRPRARPGR